MARRGTEFDTLLLTQYYWPELIGSGPYCTAIAEGLAVAGRKVMVLTNRPHYPENFVFPSYRDGERDRESTGGVVIERMPPRLSNRHGAKARIVRDVSFFMRGLWALLTHRARRSELVVCLCPSILTVLLGSLAVRPHGHLIGIVHDIESGIAGGLGMVKNRAALRLMRRFERFVLNRCACVFVLSDQMRRKLAASGVRSSIGILPIWVDTTSVRPRLIAPGPEVLALYSGNLGKKQALHQVIDLAELLQNYRSRVRVVIRGEGSEAQRLHREVRIRRLGNVEFRPLLPPSQLSAGLAEGDIHLVPQDDRAADFAVPSKVYAVMAAGRPIVATARAGGALDELSRESQAIVRVDPGDIKGMAFAVLSLAADRELRESLGKHGREFVVARHDKAHVLHEFVSALDRLP